MDPRHWLAGFKELHIRARNGSLTANEREQYDEMRGQIALSVAKSRGQSIPSGTEPRKCFQVSQVFAVELDHLYKGMTREISLSAFTVRLQAPFKQGQHVAFSLSLHRNEEPLIGHARVTNVGAPGDGGIVYHFAIDPLNSLAEERLELALFDAVLSRLN